MNVTEREMGYKTVVTHTYHLLFTTKRKLYDAFKAKYPQHVVSYSAFKRHLPWWVRKGRRETCLCWRSLRVAGAVGRGG